MKTTILSSFSISPFLSHYLSSLILNIFSSYPPHLFSTHTITKKHIHTHSLTHTHTTLDSFLFYNPQLNDLRRQQSVIFIVATNRLRSFDAAVTRPGRFDFLLFVGTPNLSSREKRLVSRLEGTRLTAVKRYYILFYFIFSKYVCYVILIYFLNILFYSIPFNFILFHLFHFV